MEHFIDLEGFEGQIWIQFEGYCDGNGGAYQLHIDDVCVFDLEYQETELVDIDVLEVVQVEFPCWEPCNWCDYENVDIPYDVRAWTELENDGNPMNDLVVKEDVLIHIPYYDDVGVISIDSPAEDYYWYDGPVEMCSTIKNFGKNDEGCFNTYMTVSELMYSDAFVEPFDCWTYTGWPNGYTPCGWTEKPGGYYGWERSYSNNAGGDRPEARLAWYYAGYYSDDILTSPSINTEAYGGLQLEFKSMIDHFTSSFEAYVEVTPDGGVSGWTDYTPWSNPVTGSIPAETYLLDINDEIGPDTQVRFRFYGYYWNLDYLR
jgi:hypothetical protein